MDKTEPCIEAFHFPLGRRIERAALSLDATVEFDGTNFDLLLTTTALAQSLCIEDASFRPADNWFHLAPGAHKRVRLTPRTKEAKRPHGVIRALNGENVSYESAPT